MASRSILRAGVVFCLLFGVHRDICAQVTSFTYQGRLNSGGNPANGLFDFQFSIYDSTNIPGALIAGPSTNSAVAVSNGLFTVSLDFGAGVFNGATRWLDIGVRTNGSAAPFSPLAPRQALSPAPYSLFSANAGLAGGVAAGAITSGMLANGAVTSNKIAPGAISALDAPDASPLRALFVNSNGAVGIGANDSGAALQVSGGAAYRNAANPTFVRAIVNGSTGVTNMSSPVRVFVTGSRAYVTSFNPGSLTIFDISNPQQPVVLGDIVDDSGRPGSPFTHLTGASGLFVTNNIAYVVAEVDRAVTIIDVTNPQNPVKLAELVNGTGGITSLDAPVDIIVDRTNLYVLAFSSSSLAVFDVSNPSNPQLRAQIFDDSVSPTSPFKRLGSPYRMALDNNLLYIAARTDNAVTILSVTNPASPQLVSEIVDDSVNQNSPFTKLAGANGVDVVGNRLYVVSGAFAGPDGSLTIIDVSNPAAPVKLSEVSDDSIVPGSPFTRLRGAWAVKVVDQTAFVTSSLENALTAIDVSNPLAPRLIAEFAQNVNGFTTLSFPAGIAISGSTLYVVSASPALNIFDLPGTLGLKVDGMVGIGTSTPRSALDVAGTIIGTDIAADRSISAADIQVRNSIVAQGNIVAGGLSIGTNIPGVPLVVAGFAGTNASHIAGVIEGIQTGGGISAGGVYGLSLVPGGNGLIGRADLTTPGSFPAGVSAYSSATNGVGFFAVASAPSAYAGYFLGRGYFSDSLGLGTTTPDRRLSIQGGSTFGEWISLKDTTGITRWHLNNFAGGINFSQTGVSDFRVYLATNGNVGIGTGSPGAKLSILGTNGNDQGIRLQNSSVSGSHFWNIHIDGNGDALVFSHDNQWPGINYSYLTPSSAGLITTSDSRVKKDIEAIPSCLDGVMALTPSTFRYRDADEESPVNYGFIAQDVERQFPALVQERNGLKTLVGAGLTAINTKAIQDLNRKLEQTRAENAELKARLEKLERLLQAR